MALTILCTHRGRDDKVNDFIYHYQLYYPQAEIILLHQADNSPFKKGQLYNIGFSLSKGDVIAFVDIDIRLQHFIDLEGTMLEKKKPFFPYEAIIHCELQPNHTYKILPHPCWQYSPGGFYCYTREQYTSINGHSNLYIGHSYEDTEIRDRGNPIRLPNTLLHIVHSNAIRNRVQMQRNERIYNTRGQRSIQADGLKQTTYVLISKKVFSPFASQYEVSNIGVVPTFVYRNLLAGV